MNPPHHGGHGAKPLSEGSHEGPFSIKSLRTADE